MATLLCVLDLSVSHLTSAARAVLDAAGADALHRMQEGRALPAGVSLSAPAAARNSPAHVLVVTPMVYGWFCYCPDETNALEEAGVPEELIRIFQHARRNGANYVLFDADAAEDPALPCFNDQQPVDPSQ